MRRIEAAKEFRSWVASEMKRTGVKAQEGLVELHGRWEGCLDRLKKAEERLVSLQKQVRCNVLYLFQIVQSST